MPTAVVTGASAGLGLAFARRLAAEGYDLVLVARGGARLDATAVELRDRYGVPVQTLVADLTDPRARAAVERRLADPDRAVHLLVNNAGSEVIAELTDAAPADLQAEIDLNITAVLQLTRAALPPMRARRSGAVINVASFAGYLPSRGSAYGASKAWVLAFTDTVAASLAGTGVDMIALCAGRIRAADDPRKLGPLCLDADAVARQCLADLRRGTTLSTPGRLYSTVVGILELPRRTLRAAARLAGRSREQRPARTPARSR